MKFYAGLALAFALVLSGCNRFDGGSSSRDAGGNLSIITLDNGLVCVKYKNLNAGGLSCNWEKFNK